MPKVEHVIGKPLSPYAITKYVNELYAQLNSENYGNFLDPFNGKEDLKNKIIKTPLDLI